ncbi:MAG: hypothetical protein VB067_06645 [Christensenellaceae bacterium]|nr:hypothetical protein [Christensenellaceae bacterium]MEA5068647.1 hypothetical protein [Christensenellaceae bacterium]
MPIVSRRRIGRIIKERGLVSAYTRKKYRVHAVRSNEAAVPILFDLDAREIIGYSAGAYKNAELVHKAFLTVNGSLFDIQMFHTDRGSEFDNALIDELLDSFQISRSLSM